MEVSILHYSINYQYIVFVNYVICEYLIFTFFSLYLFFFVCVQSLSFDICLFENMNLFEILLFFRFNQISFNICFILFLCFLSFEQKCLMEIVLFGTINSICFFSHISCTADIFYLYIVLYFICIKACNLF